MSTDFTQYAQLADDYQRISEALRYLEQHYDEQPSLQQIADSIHLSEYHFQRLFTRWVGISPKRFLQYVTKEHAKQLLAQSADVLQAAMRTGLSSPGRLHDLFITCEAVTPGEYKRRGEGLQIRYGIHPTPFGECLLALTERGVSNLIFVENGQRELAIKQLRREWPKAKLVADEDGTRRAVDQIFAAYTGGQQGPLGLHLQGTNFQIKVWEALLRIPQGKVVSYEDLAIYIGQPRAARAVGRAVALNPVPVLVPCHRVIRKMGAFGGYRYGPVRKSALLGWEIARSETAGDFTGELAGEATR